MQIDQLVAGGQGDNRGTIQFVPRGDRTVVRGTNTW